MSFHFRLREFRKFLRVVEESTTRFVTTSFSQSRNFKVTPITGSKSMKVAVLGATGRTGTCLSLLLKQSRLIDELAVYDKTDVATLQLELSHVDARCGVSASASGTEGLKETLEDAKIVIVTAGHPCDGEEDSDDVALANADILLEYVPSVVTYCPTASVALATSPVNRLLPLVAEIYKKFGVFDRNRLYGVTTLNCVRANTFASEIMGLEPERVTVPVIGGNCSKTCVPLFSHAKPSGEFTHEEIGKLTHAVRMAEDKVAREYDGRGSSSLAMGYAAARFCISLCKALRDQRGIVEYAYTRSSVIPDVTYFAGPLELGPCGIQRHLGLPPLTDRESKLLSTAIPHLKEAIAFGEALALSPRGTSTEIRSPDPDPRDREISG